MDFTSHLSTPLEPPELRVMHASVRCGATGPPTSGVVLMSIDELPDMLRVEEAASVLRIGRAAVYAGVAQFEATAGRQGIPCIRIGRSVRVPKRALVRWIDQQVGEATADGSSDAA
jgi:excisionase family DNA binding protein